MVTCATRPSWCESSIKFGSVSDFQDRHATAESAPLLGEPTFARSTRWERSRSIAAQGIAVVALGIWSLLLGRYWGARVRGEAAVLLASSTVIANCLGLGLHDAVVWARGRHSKPAQVGWVTTSIVLMLAVLVPAALAVRSFASAPSMVVVIFVTCATSQQLQRAAIAFKLADNRLLPFDLARVIGPSVLLVSAAVLVPTGWRPDGYLLYGIPTITVSLLLGFPILRQMFTGRLGIPRSVLRIGIASSLGAVAYSSLARMDVLVVAAMLGNRAAGIYGLTIGIAEATGVAAEALSFHALREGRDSNSSRLTMHAGVLSCFLTICTGLAVAWGAVPILGPGFEELKGLYWLFAPGAVAIGMLRTEFARSVARGLVGRLSRWIGFVAAVQLLADIALIRVFGLAVVAIISSASYLVILGVCHRILSRNLDARVTV